MVVERREKREHRKREEKVVFLSLLSLLPSLSFPTGGEGMASVLPGFYSATSINFLELRLLETDSATDDAASLTFETVSSLRESATLWTVGARICAAGAKAPRTDSKPAEEGEEASSATEEEEKS